MSTSRERLPRDCAAAGIDVTTALDAEMEGATDEEHLTFARAQGRVLVTRDADFLRFHQEGVAHAGIVYCGSSRRSLGRLLRYLVMICECLSAEEMHNHVEFV
jgi:predicted nuclease of predicted toxin-antitoxin system